MASKEKKGRKFGRNINRPSDRAYKSQDRAMTNKVKKLKKHVKAQPNDQFAASVLKNGGSHKPAEYPVIDKVRPSKAHDVPLVGVDFRKSDELYILESQYGCTIDVAARQKDLHEIATCGKYHLPMNLYQSMPDGKLVLKKHYPGTKMPVSRKDLLLALKNEQRV